MGQPPLLVWLSPSLSEGLLVGQGVGQPPLLLWLSPLLSEGLLVGQGVGQGLACGEPYGLACGGWDGL